MGLEAQRGVGVSCELLRLVVFICIEPPSRKKNVPFSITLGQHTGATCVSKRRRLSLGETNLPARRSAGGSQQMLLLLTRQYLAMFGVVKVRR